MIVSSNLACLRVMSYVIAYGFDELHLQREVGSQWAAYSMCLGTLTVLQTLASLGDFIIVRWLLNGACPWQGRERSVTQKQQSCPFVSYNGYIQHISALGTPLKHTLLMYLYFSFIQLCICIRILCIVWYICVFPIYLSICINLDHIWKKNIWFV